MVNKKVISLSIMCLVVLVLINVQTEASSLDKYRSILASRSYTLKFRSNIYNNLKGINNIVKGVNNYALGGSLSMPENYYTPDAPDVTKSIDESKIHEMHEKYMQIYDVIVMDGDNRYTEIRGNCKLIKDGKVFTYRYNVLKDKYEGGHISKRGSYHFNEVAEGENYLLGVNVGFGKKMTNQNEIEDVGEPLLMKMLAVIYPVSKANVDIPEYHFVSSKQLQDGSMYEDYAGEMDGRKHVVRCYFRNGELERMAYASYLQSSDMKRDDVEKYSIDIKEITNVPDQKYFSLPANLKVAKD